MEINIKLKFSQQKQKKLLDFISKQDCNFSMKDYLDKQNQQIVKKYSPENHLEQPQIYNIQSFRQHIQKSSIFNRKTPKHSASHKRSKSKQIVNSSKGKKKNQQQSKIITNRKKKQSITTTLTQNKNFMTLKPRSTKINKKQNFQSCKTNIVNNPFTGKLQGLDGKKVLKQFQQYLSETEKIQIINEKQVYYIGTKNKMSINEDDLQGNYIWQKHDHLGFRYQLLQKLGCGSFGQVIKAFDHKIKKYVAIKIIKSKKQHMQLALNEINILMIIKQKDVQSQKNCVKLKDFLVFRNHMCLIFQLLSISLYQLLKLNQFQGIKMDFIRRFAIQILNALSFLKKNRIIHSDIKPQNILLKSKTKTGIKIIDFGTSMLENEKYYDYIQSRFYRAPEVILGKSYGYEIDMWSVGCVLAQLYTGSPLFPGDNQQQQLSLIFQAIGIPKKQYLQNCKKCFTFFYNNLTPKIIKTREGKVVLPQTKPLSKRIQDNNFLDFLQKIFVWQEDERMTPLQALMHPWILQGLPKQIRQQHLIYIKQQLKNQQVPKRKQNENLNRSPSKKKRLKRNQRISQLYVQKKLVQKHKRRRSDGLY